MVLINGIKHAHIYRMEDTITGYYYIGSTFNELKQRKKGHKQDSKRRPNTKVYQHITDWDNVKMKCLKFFECDNKQQKDIEEYKFICEHFDDELCVNSKKTGTGLTEKEWYAKNYETNKEYIDECHKKYYEENKEKVAKAHKIYRDTHKEETKTRNKIYCSENKDKIKDSHKKYWIEKGAEIKEKLKVKVTCECDSVIRKADISKHKKTKKHLEYIKNNINI